MSPTLTVILGRDHRSFYVTGSAMASTPVISTVRGVSIAVLVGMLTACHFGSGAGNSVNPPPPSSSSSPSPSPTVDLAALYPGQVGVHFASDPGASSKTVDCAGGVNFDIVVTTDGRPVKWKAGSSDNSNNFVGNPIGGIDVTPDSGTLQGGETATVHVSGAPSSPVQTFWIGATDVRGSGATLQVDCAQ
jgi:hypothetical protein